MNPSIRKYLLVNLLLGVTIVILLTAIVNYYLAQHDIERHLDILLSQSAYSIDALISDDISQRNLSKLQSQVKEISRNVRKALKKIRKETEVPYRNTFEFQIWNAAGKMILHTKKAPAIDLINAPTGFSIKTYDHIPWRIFKLHNQKTGISILVAERFNTRHALGRRITNDYLLTILFAYPLLGLLIWCIVGRGLGSLKRVTNELSHRDPSYLEPVDTQSVPVEIKPLVDELNELFLRLQQAFGREKRFASDAAHELRTPLAALKTQAQVALKSANTQEKHATLIKVLSGVDRCTHIVEQLLTLSRLVPEASTLHDITKLNLPHLITEVLAELAPTAVDKQIDIELIADDQDINIMGNTTAITILARNLIDNAIRYTPEGGQIKVFVFAEGDKATIRVQDNGPGIPAELRARVFERFYRVLGNKSPGSGLGLAIVQQIASFHNATVTLSEPESGTGLVVDITFPKIN